MAGISAGGIGSGLDVPGLVQQLVAAERSPSESRLNAHRNLAQTRLSAFGALKSAFETLQTSLKAFTTDIPFKTFTATSSTDTVFTATAGTTAAAGSYQVEVLTVAASHKLRSTGFAEATTFGAGSLNIAAGALSIDVDITADATLQSVRDAINSAAAGKGVAASIVHADDGDHLVLTATDAGSAGALRVTRTGGDAALDAFVFDPGVQTVMVEQTAASDASVRIDGLLRTSSSNLISDALTGVSINLKTAKPGETGTLTVARDNTAASKALQSLVTSYNAALSTLAATSKYDPATRSAAVLNGDPLVRGAASQLRNALGAALGLAAESGISADTLGIKTAVDGTLTFDAAKFQSALAAEPVAVQAMLSGTGGLVTGLKSVTDGLLGSTGLLAGRTDGLDRQLKSLTTQREALDRRMEALETRYLAQFTAMDVIVAQLQNTGSFLVQQLATFNANNSSRNR